MSRYIKSKEMFFDAAASMPIDTAFRLAGHHSTSGYLRMLRLLRLERAAEMYAHFSDVPFSLPFRVVVSLLSRVVVLFPPGRYAFFNDFMDKQSSRLPGLGIVVNLLALTCSLMLFNHISCCLVRERPSISSCLSLCCHHCLPPPQTVRCPCCFTAFSLPTTASKPVPFCFPTALLGRSPALGRAGLRAHRHLRLGDPKDREWRLDRPRIQLRGWRPDCRNNHRDDQVRDGVLLELHDPDDRWLWSESSSRVFALRSVAIPVATC